MKNCPLDKVLLQPAFTKQGVEVESCPHCRGIWLDKDEIYHFTRLPTYLKTKLTEAISNVTLSDRVSPVSGMPMQKLRLFSDVEVEYCPQSGGLWLDQNEIQKFPVDQALIELDVDHETKTAAGLSVPPGVAALNPLPNLFVSSVSVLFGMYALVTLFLIVLVQVTELSVSTALMIGVTLVVLQFLFAPFMTDLMLRWLYRLNWKRSAELPPHLEQFITAVCQKEKIPFPRVGIIEDGSPQAFTYGHHPGNARVVVSRGLMSLLQKEELEAVVAHEIGHVVHWDMLVMTVVQLVPLLLYYVYRSLIRMRSGGRNDKSAGARYLVAISAYILYVISEYVVLWFSRIREYYADRYAGMITGQPNMLASALVKIGYGLASEKPKQDENKKSQSDMVGFEPLGIFDRKTANILALNMTPRLEPMGGKIDPQTIKEVASWDLWNPWAGYYELHSTHPLIAKRLEALSNLSEHLGQESPIKFNEHKPESYWDDFLIDVIVHLLPALVLLVGLGWYFMGFLNGGDVLIDRVYAPLGIIVLLFGLSYLGKTLYAYPVLDFAPMNVRALLKKIKVSAVRPVPCKISGYIIGRGVPGLLYSEDFVLQDKTGIIFLDYQQPMAIINFFFGLLRARHYQNKYVEVVGWFRRAPVPYIEVKELRADDKTSVCYTYHVKIALSIVAILIGVFIYMA